MYKFIKIEYNKNKVMSTIFFVFVFSLCIFATFLYSLFHIIHKKKKFKIPPKVKEPTIDFLLTQIQPQDIPGVELEQRIRNYPNFDFTAFNASKILQSSGNTLPTRILAKKYVSQTETEYQD